MIGSLRTQSRPLSDAGKCGTLAPDSAPNRQWQSSIADCAVHFAPCPDASMSVRDKRLSEVDNYAETIALRVFDDYVVSVIRLPAPVHLTRTHTGQASNFRNLTLRIQVKVNTRGSVRSDGCASRATFGPNPSLGCSNAKSPPIGSRTAQSKAFDQNPT